MMKGCGAHKLSWILVIIGGLNWGLVGLGELLSTNLNLVYMLVGTWPMVEAIVYLLVGLATVAMLAGGKCKSCKVDSSM